MEPVQPVALALVVVAVLQEAQTAPWPRSSTFCSAARGAAAASPRREGIMTWERMAMRTCEDLSGKRRLLDGVVVLTLQFLW